MTFYTYIYLREDGSPYYVGKGSGRRAFARTPGHNPPKDVNRILISDLSDENTAFEIESFLIAFWGRKDLGTGTLINITDGGEGPSNPSKATRELLRRNGHVQGLIQGRKNADSGLLASICSAGGRVGGRVSGRKAADSGQLARVATFASRAKGGRQNVNSGHLARIRTPERQKAASNISRHVRWHFKRAIVKVDCPLCITSGGTLKQTRDNDAINDQLTSRP
jgi:hypothetical protein